MDTPELANAKGKPYGNWWVGILGGSLVGLLAILPVLLLWFLILDTLPSAVYIFAIWGVLAVISLGSGGIGGIMSNIMIPGLGETWGMVISGLTGGTCAFGALATIVISLLIGIGLRVVYVSALAICKAYFLCPY